MLEITAFWYGKPNLLCPVRKLCCIGRLLQPLISYREMQATNIVSTQVPLINFHRLPTYLPTYLPTHPPTYLPLHYNGSQEFFKKSHKKNNKDAKRFFSRKQSFFVVLSFAALLFNIPARVSRNRAQWLTSGMTIFCLTKSTVVFD